MSTPTGALLFHRICAVLPPPRPQNAKFRQARSRLNSSSLNARDSLAHKQVLKLKWGAGVGRETTKADPFPSASVYRSHSHAPPPGPNANSSLAGLHAPNPGTLCDSSRRLFHLFRKNSDSRASTVSRNLFSQHRLSFPNSNPSTQFFLLRVIRAANGSVYFVWGSIASELYAQVYPSEQAYHQPHFRRKETGAIARRSEGKSQGSPLLTPRPCTDDAGKSGRNTFSKTGLLTFYDVPMLRILSHR